MDCCSPTPAAGPILAQVLGLGLVWTTLHCAGMCGPLIAGLRLGSRGCSLSAATAAGDVAAYQFGRLVTFAVMGSIAGAVGGSVLSALGDGALVMGFLIGAGLFISALARLFSRRRQISGSPGIIARLAARMSRVAPGRPRLGAFLLGLTLGLMPCMIVAWALSLAAASGDPLVGAAVMMCLVGLTVPVLTLSALVPAVVGRLRRASAAWVGPTAMLFSSCWMLIIASASAGWIGHYSLSLGSYAVMFW